MLARQQQRARNSLLAKLMISVRTLSRRCHRSFTVTGLDLGSDSKIARIERSFAALWLSSYFARVFCPICKFCLRVLDVERSAIWEDIESFASSYSYTCDANDFSNSNTSTVFLG